MTKLTILGSGTSQGVPTIGCNCQVCHSKDARDIRLRSAAYIEHEGLRILIDAGPDLRAQLLREGIRSLDAILLTHLHRDHTGGLDDLRALCFADYPTIHRMQIYTNEQTANAMRHDYHYAFAENKYLGAPEIDLHTIKQGGSFTVANEDGTKSIEILAIEGFHAKGVSLTAYRLGDLAYLTDFKHIEEREIERLQGLKVLVVNALRWTEHYSHFNVEQALDLIAKLRPEKAFLTHCSHDIGLYDAAQAKLPEGVALAYDGLKVSI